MPDAHAAPAAPAADRPGAVLMAPDEAEPGRFVLRNRRVPLMPVHERTIVLRHPETGRALRDKDGRIERRTVRCDERTLRAIAADANARSARKSDIPITLGHVRLFDRDERAQPETVGFYRDFGVGPLLDASGAVIDERPHLYADEHVARDRLDEARGYPRRSTEIDPDYADPARSTLDSVALLRRAPEHEMGLILNERDDEAPAAAAAEGEPEPPAARAGGDHDPGPPGADTQAPGPGEDAMNEDALVAKIVEQVGQAVAQAISANNQPLALALADALSGGGDDEPAPGADDASQTVQNAGQMAGADNTFAPGVVPDEPEDTEQNCGQGGKVQYARQSDLLAVRGEVDRLRADNAKLRGENAALKAQVDADSDYVGNLYVQNCRDKVARDLDALEAEGVKFNRPKEERHLLEKLEDAADREEHIANMREQYARVPRARGLDLETAAPRRGGPAGALSPADSRTVRNLALKHGLDFPEAKARFLAGSLA